MIHRTFMRIFPRFHRASNSVVRTPVGVPNGMHRASIIRARCTKMWTYWTLKFSLFKRCFECCYHLLKIWTAESLKFKRCLITNPPVTVPLDFRANIVHNLKCLAPEISAFKLLRTPTRGQLVLHMNHRWLMVSNRVRLSLVVQWID